MDHLGEDGGFGTADVDSGASSGDTGVEASGLEHSRDYPILTNATSSAYPKGSAAQVQSDLFNGLYSNLLRALHRTFNGQPDYLNSAVGLMFDLKIQAIKLMQIPLGEGLNAAPEFCLFLLAILSIFTRLYT